MFFEIQKGGVMLYNDIAINEGKLLANNIVSTLIFLFLIVICVMVFCVYRCKENPKTQNRMKRLKVKAETDSNAKKQLEKLESKQKKRKKDGISDKVLIFSLLLVLIAMNLFIAVIPGWTDYIKKDYIVYGGDLNVEYEVHRHIRSSSIILEDGTVLSGGFGLDEGKHSETIVYAKRTKIVIGIDK